MARARAFPSRPRSRAARVRGAPQRAAGARPPRAGAGPRGPQRAEGAQRDLAAEPIEHDIDAFTGELAHPGQEVLMLVVDRHRAEPLDRSAVASRTGAVEPKPDDRS